MAALLALLSSFIFKGSYDDDDDDSQEKAKALAEFTHLVKENNIDEIRKRLDDGFDVDSKLAEDKKSRTAFIYACGKNKLELVRLCVERGANINTKTYSYGGMSGLDLAAKKGNVEILKYLIEELKMSPDFSDTVPMTPLHWACAYTQLEASKYLVSVGANFRRTTSQGSTIFSLACSGRNRTMMQWLLGLDLDAAVADKTGTCPIHIMAKHGPLDLLKLFIESGKANIHALDGSGRTAVDIADAHLMHEAALYLWELGVDRKVQKTLNLSLRNTRCVLKGPSHSHCATLSGTSKVLGLAFDVPNSLALDVLDLDDVQMEPLFPVSEWKSQTADMKLNSTACGDWIKVLDDGLTFVSDYKSNSGDWEPCIVRAEKPFPKSQRIGYFEIEIIGIGERNIITVGLTEEDMNLNHVQPGWIPRTYGFHGDDGAFFEGNGQGVPFASRWTVGDVIGCGVDYETGAIFFSRNGEYIGAPSRTARKRDQLYATMGIENAGVEVRVNFGDSGPFRFNFEAPTVAWKSLLPDVPEIEKASSNFRLFSHDGKLVVMQDTKSDVFDIDFSKTPAGVKHLESCKVGIYDTENFPNFGSSNACMDSSGNLWHLVKTFYSFGIDLSIYGDRSTRGAQTVFRTMVDDGKRNHFLEIDPADESSEDEEDMSQKIDINSSFVNEISLEASANLRALSEVLLSVGDMPGSIAPHPSLPNHIIILTKKNSIISLSFPTFSYKISLLKGEMLPTGCTLVPLNDRCLAAVGGSARSMRAESDVVSLIDVVSCQTFSPEIISDAVAACEGSLTIAPLVSNPILTGAEATMASGSEAKRLPCIVELSDYVAGYDVSLPVVISQSAGDDLETLLRSNPAELSDVEIEFSDNSVLKSHRCVIWSRCSSLRKQMENLTESRVTLAGNPRFSRALIKYFYTNNLDAGLIEDDSRSFVEFVQQMAPEHRQNILELLILTKPVTSSRIGQDLNQLVNNQLFCDIHLTVDGAKLAAHKSILISRSAYFSALLLGGLKESRMKEIPFTGVSFKSLEMIVRYLYTQDLDPIFSAAGEDEEGAVVPELFSLACQYGIRKLRRDLENILVYNISSDNASSLLLLADRYNALQLRSRCKALFESEKVTIESSEDYIQNKEEIEAILQKF